MENKSDLYVLGIVAIIAVIGIITMISTNANIRNSDGDNIGYAVSVPLATNTCYDTDGGINFATKGVISGILSGTKYSYSDLCLNDSNGNPSKVLGEYYCLNNSPKSTSTFCTNGCSNGACIQNTTVNTCIDSDGGMNLTVKGNASNSTTTIVDVCATPTVITEAICSGNNPVRSTTGCPTNFICSNGACIQNTTPYICTDSDGGKVYNVKGNTTGIFSGTTIGTFTDQCASVSMLQEGYCDNNTVKTVAYQCPNGCSNGICNPVSCTDECNATSKMCVGYATYKQCGNYDNDSCLEWSTSQTCGAQTPLCLYTNGSCIANTPCGDTDGGQNPDVTGYVYGTFQQWIQQGRDIYLTGAQPIIPNGLPYNRWPDHCYYAGNLTNQVEVYCANVSGTIVVGEQMIYCENGCNNATGKCI